MFLLQFVFYERKSSQNHVFSCVIATNLVSCFQLDVVRERLHMKSNSNKGRAANGFGSIRKRKRKRKDGSYYEYWEGRITLYYDSKAKEQVSKAITGKTQAEVIEKMKFLGIETEEPTDEVLGLHDWLDIWQAEYLESVKPSTAYLYKRDIELYILPHLGRYDLDELTPTIIQKFYNRLLHPSPSSEKKALSAKTVRDIHGVLHQALEQAVKSGEMESNPTKACKLPKVQKTEIAPLEDSQVCSFLENIGGHTHEYLYKIALFTGLREGEILGLTWDCIDFNRSRLTVKQQLRKEQQKGGTYYFSVPKNGKQRTLALSPSVLRLFHYQKQRQTMMRAEAKEWKNKNLVFTNKNGDFLSYRTVYDCFKRIAKKMGLPDLRFHDLRHQYAVISIKNGDDIKTIQGNLGHATAAFTLDIYGHVTEEMKKDSSNRMENYIKSVAEM